MAAFTEVGQPAPRAGAREAVSRRPRLHGLSRQPAAAGYSPRPSAGPPPTADRPALPPSVRPCPLRKAGRQAAGKTRPGRCSAAAGCPPSPRQPASALSSQTAEPGHSPMPWQPQLVPAPLTAFAPEPGPARPASSRIAGCRTPEPATSPDDDEKRPAAARCRQWWSRRRRQALRKGERS
jgi:hypothetical protein